MSLSKKLSIKDLNFCGQKVFVRVDFNVPLEGKVIQNNQRIVAALPTIEYISKQKPKCIILASHLGRPNGEKNEKYSMEPICKEVERLMNRKVFFLKDCVGINVEKEIKECSEGSIFLLNNLRFHAEEEGFQLVNGKKQKIDKKQIDEFQKQLSKLTDIYVNDAFGCVHRTHSSIVGIEVDRKASGFLMSKELEYFSKVLENPKRPLLAILGGAKVSDKIQLIDNLLNLVDIFIICGGMAFTFKKVLNNMSIGNSIFDVEGSKSLKSLVSNLSEKNVKCFLPIDFVIANKFDKDAEKKEVTEEEGIPDNWMGLDIGKKSCKIFGDVISQAKTIIWNGPPGVFEFERFADGTKSLLEAVIHSAKKNNCVIIGGGDTATVASKYNATNLVSHVSTGGGASLELLRGKNLPGIAYLSDKS